MTLITEQDIRNYEDAIDQVASGDNVQLLYVYEPVIDEDWGTASGDSIISGCNVIGSIQPMYSESESQLRTEGFAQEDIGVIDRTQRLGFFTSGDVLISGDIIYSGDEFVNGSLPQGTYTGDTVVFNTSVEKDIIKLISHNNIMYEIIEGSEYRTNNRVFGYEIYLKRKS